MERTPCYGYDIQVLNLIINGLPSKLKRRLEHIDELIEVLNLIINGLPSKRFYVFRRFRAND